MMSRARTRQIALEAILLVVSAVVVYWPALGAAPVWDDVIARQYQYSVIDTVGEAFFPPADTPYWGAFYYRPLTTLTHVFDGWFYGPQNTAGPHATNMLLHISATLLVWVLARQWFGGESGARWGALGAALVFAVHPIHTESVSWISGRTDVVATVFTLAALIAGLKFRRTGSPGWLPVAPVLFLLAVLAKETAFSALPLLPLLMLWRPVTGASPEGAADRRRPARRYLFASFFGGAILFYCLLRHAAGTLPAAPTVMAAGDGGLSLVRAVAFYLMKMIWPPPQSHFITPDELPGPWAAGGILAVAVGGFAWALRRRRLPWLPPALAWFGCTLLPSLYVAVVPVASNPVAERYLYLPSVGFCLALGGAWRIFGTRRWMPGRAAMAVFLAVCCLCGIQTISRGMAWQDGVALWAAETGQHPGDPLCWLELGLAHQHRGETAAALDCFNRVLDHAPETDGETRGAALANMGMLHLDAGKPAAAIPCFRRSARVAPRSDTPHFGLGAAALKLGLAARDRAAMETGLVRAIGHFEDALRRNPRSRDACWELGQTQMRLGDLAHQAGRPRRTRACYRAAMAAFEQLVRIDPQAFARHPGRRRVYRLLHARLGADEGHGKIPGPRAEAFQQRPGGF